LTCICFGIAWARLSRGKEVVLADSRWVKNGQGGAGENGGAFQYPARR
jgi:hypothetical protein